MRARGSHGAADAPRGRLRVAAMLAILFGWPAAASAHEPLWGETPTIFGPHVFHPEVRFGFMHRGSAAGAGGQDFRDVEQEYGLQYGINRFVNVRLTLPAVRTDLEENVAGTTQETRVTGIGDALLSAKYRFHVRQAVGLQTSQALVFGWKVPTGADDLRSPGGARLAPVDQPGSGRHGIRMGYSIDRERLVDTAWASAFYRHEFGTGFRRGDAVEADAAYGRWCVRPNVAEDLGVMLAVGLHGEAAADDRLEGGLSAGNGHQVAGLHVTPIITRGRTQYRIGIFVPLLKGGDKQQTDFGYELRAGWETFF